ncbi:MAG: DNA internalization-related competence protein ComEC/Rec2 [Elusimicrobia bacterium]|nr:DNA internalization-related competence protein ComEC/Rec2 [Elusimicrobiota bacterium]
MDRTLKYPPFIFVLLISSGIVLAHVLKVGFAFLIFLNFILFLLAFLFSKYLKLYYLFIGLSLIVLGMNCTFEKAKRLKEDLNLGSTYFIGRISSFPSEILSPHGTKVRFKFKCDRKIGRQFWFRFDQTLLVSLPKPDFDLQYGDELLIKGELKKPQESRNPGSFNTEAYFEREGIFAWVHLKEKRDTLLLARGKGNFILAFIGKLRWHLIKMINKNIPPPQNSVVSALLLGDQKNIPFEIKDDFVKSGSAHLLAISGGNIALLSGLLLLFLKWFSFPKRFSYFVTLVALIFYCLLTGWSSSILRATFMACAYFLGLILKQDGEAMVSFSWSAIFILIFDPFQLFDPGFQFSYITVFALLTLIPPQEKNISDKFSRTILGKTFFSLKQIFLTSFVAWIGVMPLIAYYFYLWNPVAILSNIFTVPYFSFVITGGFFWLIFGSLNNFFADTLALSLDFLTRILIWLCKVFASFPYAYIHVKPPPILAILLFYGLIFIYIFRNFLKSSVLKFLILILCIANFLFWKELLNSETQKLKITFLDVGHGDSIFFEFPNKGNLLVDCGSGGILDQGRITIAPFLRSKGINTLDAILITHPHLDHYGGVRYLLNEFKVKRLFDNGDRTSYDYETIFKNRSLERQILKSGDQILGFGEARLDILYPYKRVLEDPTKGPNDQSIVFKLEVGQFSLLMTGDIEEKALSQLKCLKEKLKSKILKIPHHGSYENKSEEEFVTHAQPEAVIISESENNTYHLPSPLTLNFLKNFGCALYQTGFCGAIECITDGKSFEIKTRSTKN